MIRVGISGWSYPEWRGGFYPRGLPPRDALAYASRRFATIEINATFYGQQPLDRFERWHDATPADFVFAVKGARRITHFSRLADSAANLASFLAGPLRLRDKLGPVLWQLPSRLALDMAVLDRFLAALPRDTAAAARLAGVSPLAEWPLRHAIEVRHESFGTSSFFDLLRRHDVALVVADGLNVPPFTESTGSFAYVRLHGTGPRYRGSYGDAELGRWAERINAWAAQGAHDVFVYFNNTMKGEAPVDAAALARRLDLKR